MKESLPRMCWSALERYVGAFCDGMLGEWGKFPHNFCAFYSLVGGRGAGIQSQQVPGRKEVSNAQAQGVFGGGSHCDL